ncbi:MAG: hypothetical protein ACP5SI_10570 [Chloroflexia bacterium]
MAHPGQPAAVEMVEHSVRGALVRVGWRGAVAAYIYLYCYPGLLRAGPS